MFSIVLAGKNYFLNSTSATQLVTVPSLHLRRFSSFIWVWKEVVVWNGTLFLHGFSIFAVRQLMTLGFHCWSREAFRFGITDLVFYSYAEFRLFF